VKLSTLVVFRAHSLVKLLLPKGSFQLGRISNLLLEYFPTAARIFPGPKERAILFLQLPERNALLIFVNL
jgi:hypothetical protein